LPAGSSAARHRMSLQCWPAWAWGNHTGNDQRLVQLNDDSVPSPRAIVLLAQPNRNQDVGLMQNRQRLSHIRLFTKKGYSQLLELAFSFIRHDKILEVRLAASKGLRYSGIEGERKKVDICDEGHPY